MPSLALLHRKTLRTALHAWPLAVLALEIFLHWQEANTSPLHVTPLALAVAAGVLLSGLVPLFARPSRDTRLAAGLAILLASIMVTPLGLQDIPPLNKGSWLWTASPETLLHLLNSGLAITVFYHLTTTFPPRPHPALPYLRTWRGWLALYGLSVAWMVMLVLSAAGWLRMASLLLSAIWFFLLMTGALRHLLQTARLSDPAYTQSAQQARLLLFGLLLAATPIILRLILYASGEGIMIPYEVAQAMQIAIPISVAYATLRLDLFGIDAAVRRTLAYGTIFSFLLAAYLGFTLLLTRVLLTNLPHLQSAAIFGALLLSAVLFRPTYHLLQQGMDRLLYPERMRFQQEMAILHSKLQQVLSREQVLSLLNKELPARLQATWGRLILAPAPETPDPDKPRPAWNTRLVIGQRVLGRYWLGPRRSGLAFDASERRQLQALLAQAALALAYAETLAELNRLNAELKQRVALQTERVLDQERALAAAEERQRLARDLHDSVTQTLFSLSLGARALRKLALQDPQAAAEGLREQEIAAQQALREMRALLAQLRSPLPDDDLISALRQHCEQLGQQTGLQVELHLPDSLAVSHEQATALYYIAREALHNVIKHSHTHEATCTLQQLPDVVSLTIEDRGQGFDVTAAELNDGHLGLQNMRQRAENLGGTLTIASEPGKGTRITAQLPIPPRSR